MLDGGPTGLIKGNREGLGSCRWRAFVLGFRTVEETISTPVRSQPPTPEVEPFYLPQKGNSVGGKLQREHLRSTTSFLDVILARFPFTPGNDSNALVVQRWDKVFPTRDFLQVCVVLVEGFLVHVAVDGLEELRDSSLEVSKRDRSFRTGITTDRESLFFHEIIWPNLKTEWHTL